MLAQKLTLNGYYATLFYHSNVNKSFYSEDSISMDAIWIDDMQYLIFPTATYRTVQDSVLVPVLL